jgi:formate dehydrogenase major subunit
MTNHWIDLKNSDCIFIMGSNAAEHHPVCFKWILKAKEENGAKIMHVDPKFSRTTARSDFHVPLRSGTDLAFLGGMLKYIIENKKYFAEYVIEYTNASFIIEKEFKFTNGMFSGYDATTRFYDKSSWSFKKDANGVPLRDKTLKDERCVFQLMKEHYSRYNIEDVSKITGVSEENLLKVWETFAATGEKGKAGAICYALGWTQHTVGVQNIRASALIQLLLGNIGIAGGGIEALRGEPNVQGSTDHAILWHLLPGYLPMPQAKLTTLADYNKANTPVSNDPQSVNWWQNRPAYVTSLLKGWYGDKGTKENGFGYDWLPKADTGEDYSYLYIFDRMYNNQIKGGFIWGTNPAQTVPNSNKVRKAMDNLEWVCFAEVHNTETTDFWHRPDVDPKKIKTECFLLPSANRAEKEGSISNSGRWQLWHYQATKPQGECLSLGDISVKITNKVRELYQKEGGVYPEPLLNLDFPTSFEPEKIAQKCNGWFTKETEIKGKLYKKGQQVPSFTALKDDGSTVCLNWIYAGGYTEEVPGKKENKSKQRDFSQTPEQAAIGLFPNYSWCWPVNRRILYNRASVDLNGQPWAPDKAVIRWDGTKWIGDVPDGGAPPLATGKGTYPFIMEQEGHGKLFGPGRMEGPFPEHYEPIETPVETHPFSAQLHNPCAVIFRGEMDKLAEPADKRFPIVLTTYSMTEHWCGGGETRYTAPLLEAEPQLYVEMSPELAKEKGIENGDPVLVESIRGRVEAIAMVTVRFRPFTIQGKTVHEVGMPFCFGWITKGCGDSTNRLTPSVGDPNTTIPEYKACLVNIKKADRLKLKEIDL